MVYFSEQSVQDIDDFVVGLLKWQKFELSVEFVQEYRNIIISNCISLDTKSFHFNTRFTFHRQFGQKVHTYRRNKQTVWYIIYNLDVHGNVYIQRLLSNHNTID